MIKLNETFKEKLFFSRTKPDGRSCLAMNGNSCAWHRGKVIGGTSVVNGMLYVRGSKEDYNEWERQGNPGWSYEDVLPFFKKSEDQQNPDLALDTRYHSTGGLLPVSTPSYQVHQMTP